MYTTVYSFFLHFRREIFRVTFTSHLPEWSMLNWTDFDFSFLASKTWFSRFTITIAQPDRSRLVCQLKFQHDFTFVACHAISRFVQLLPIIPSFHGPPGARWKMSPRRATQRRYAMAACRTPAGALTHLINFVDSWMSLNYHSYKTTHPIGEHWPADWSFFFSMGALDATEIFTSAIFTLQEFSSLGRFSTDQ